MADYDFRFTSNVTVHRSWNRITEECVVIKVDRQEDRFKRALYESKVYEELTGLIGFPMIFRSGPYDINKKWGLLAMTELGRTLEQLRVECGGSFTLLTTLLIADQVIRRLRDVHERSFIHGNIEPRNIVLSNDRFSTQICLIDFASSRKIDNSGSWSDFERQPPPVNDFTSRNASRGGDPSPCDDLESLGYMLVYFYNGRLPWHGLREGEEKSIIAMKNDIEGLCDTLPPVFREYFRLIDSCVPGEKPNHQNLLRIFDRCFTRFGFDKTRREYDWCYHREEAMLKREDPHEDHGNVFLIEEQEGWRLRCMPVTFRSFSSDEAWSESKLKSYGNRIKASFQEDGDRPGQSLWTQSDWRAFAKLYKKTMDCYYEHFVNALRVKADTTWLPELPKQFVDLQMYLTARLKRVADQIEAQPDDKLLEEVRSFTRYAYFIFGHYYDSVPWLSQGWAKYLGHWAAANYRVGEKPVKKWLEVSESWFEKAKFSEKQRQESELFGALSGRPVTPLERENPA